MDEFREQYAREVQPIGNREFTEDILTMIAERYPGMGAKTEPTSTGFYTLPGYGASSGWH